MKTAAVKTPPKGAKHIVNGAAVWTEVSLGEVCEIQLGKMLSPKSKTGANPLPYLRNANVQWDRFDLADVARMDFDEREAAKFALRRGDLLVCEGGEPGRAAVWDGEISPCYYQKALHRLRPRAEKADAWFLMCRLRHGAYRREFLDDNAKTTIAHLPATRLEKLRIALPPLGEQRRIAGRLREVLAEVARARAALEAQLAAARALPAAHLRAIFESQAATRWPSRILSDVADTGSGRTPPRGTTKFFQGKIPWVKTGELRDCDIVETEESVSEDAIAHTALRLLPPATLLVAMYGQGQTRGRTGLLKVAATTNQACFAILPSAHFAPRFLQYWFQYRYAWLREMTEGRGGNQPNLNGLMLRKLAVPVPPLPTQRTLAAQLEEQFAATATLRAALEARLAETERLPAALLREAFAGRL